MSKKDTPETPKSGPKHFGETLPDLKVEQGKKLPTGSAKLIAIDAAKEIGKLTYDLVKSGGLLTPVKLVTLAWTAYKVYSTAKAEALRKLNETYLTGRDVWAQHIMGDVEGGEFNVSGNEPVKQDIRDYLHGTPPAPTSPLRETVRTQYRKQKEYEAVIASLEQLEQGAAVTAESLSANPPEQTNVAARAERLQTSLAAGEAALKAAADAFPEEAASPATQKHKAEDFFESTRREGFADNPLTLADWLASGASQLATRGAQGLLIQPVGKPAYLEEQYADKRGYRKIDGTLSRNGTTVEISGLVVNHYGSPVRYDEAPSLIRITTADGQSMDLRFGDRCYFSANGRYYDYHSGTADSAHVGRMIINAMEALEQS